MVNKLKTRIANDDEDHYLRIKHFPKGDDGVEETYYVNPMGDVEIDIRPESLVLIKGGITFSAYGTWPATEEERAMAWEHIHHAFGMAAKPDSPARAPVEKEKEDDAGEQA